MQISHRPWGWRWHDEFPGCKPVARWMTGDALSANKDDKFYLIVDESILASVLPPDDSTRDELFTVLEFDTGARRDKYAKRFRVYELFSPRT